MDQVDTLKFDSSVTINTAGTYVYKAYSVLPGDSDLSNDTTSSSITIAVVPTTPVGIGATLCKSGVAVISASSSTPGCKTSWFASATSDTLLATTDTFTTPKITTPTKYYAESQKYFADSISTDTPTYGTLRSNNGCMFDIKAKSSLYIDSFYVKTFSTGKARVELYYREGSYIGHEVKSKDWTFVGFDTVAGVGLSLVPCYIHIPKVLSAGKTYGIYIRTTTDNTNYDVGSKVFTKKDMVLTTGASVSGLFGTPQKGGQSVVTTRNWNGNVFYHLATCPSNRTAVTINFSSLKTGYTYKNTCSGTQFTDTSKAGSGAVVSTWFWDFGDSTTATTQNPIHNYKYAGTKIVKLISGLGGGCTDSSIQTITVNASPKAAFTFANICNGDSVRFTNKSLPTGASLSYNWDFGDKSTSSSATNPAHKYASISTYSVRLITTYAGCNDTTTQSVTINPKPSVNFGYVLSCNSENVKFTDSSFVKGGGTYSWDFGDGSAKGTTNTPTHTYSNFNPTTVRLKITSTTTGCIDSFSRTLSFYTGSKAQFTLKDSVCSGNGNAMKFSNTNVSTGAKYTWDFGDGSKVTAKKDTSHSYAKGGTYKVMLIALNSNGCNDTLKKTVTILQSPDASFTFSKVGFQKFKFIPKDSTITNFIWNFGDSFTDKINIKPVHGYKGNLVHIVSFTATSKNNCTSTSMDTTPVSTFIETEMRAVTDIRIYPNPFKESTIISYQLENAVNVSLEVYDMTGRKVATLASGNEGSGEHSVVFDPTVYQIKAGVYMLRVFIGESLQSKQLIYVK